LDARDLEVFGQHVQCGADDFLGVLVRAGLDGPVNQALMFRF